VAIAKGIASGLPLGATVAPKDLMTWPPGSHGNTFGGNPVSCVAALATMDLIENGLLENARKIGAFLAKELAAMMERHEHIGWVNAIGLMIGIEMVAKPGTNLPAPEMRDAVELECYKRGVLVLGAGPSAVRMAPPLLLTRAQAQVALEVFEAAVTTVEQSKLGRTQRAAKRPVGRKG
jgi:4-aminobutyrate aminotransferase